mgnify:CR=1 FL=1
MLEQKKLPILEALAAFGIGGIFTAACDGRAWPT